MKRYLFFIYLFIIFLPITTYAEEEDSFLSFNEPIISFDNIENYNLQGFTTTDKYLFIVLVGNNDTASIIKVYDLDNFELVKEFPYTSLGHANDITYNSKEDLIYILDSGGSNIVHVFSNHTFNYIRSFSIDLPARSITYIDKLDKYAIRTIGTGFILENDFTLQRKIPFIIGMNIHSDVAHQGWAYYNNYLFYSNWSWIRLGGDGTNLIYIYNLQGQKVDILHTSNDIGELEDISFYNNKMILGFNGYDDLIKFYMLDIPTLPNEDTNIKNEPLLKDDSQDETKDNLKKETSSTNNNNYHYLFYIIILLFLVLIFTILRIIFNKKKKDL